jgi:hypothetical protein
MCYMSLKIIMIIYLLIYGGDLHCQRDQGWSGIMDVPQNQTLVIYLSYIGERVIW